MTPVEAPSLTIRIARAADAPALARLAELDSSRVPTGTVLVAEVGGELLAAVSTDDFHAVADPFQPTGELVFVLLERARGLRRDVGSRHARPHAWTARRSRARRAVPGAA